MVINNSDKNLFLALFYEKLLMYGIILNVIWSMFIREIAGISFRGRLSTYVTSVDS